MDWMSAMVTPGFSDLFDDLEKSSDGSLTGNIMNQRNNLVMRMSRIRFLLVLMCVSAGLWIAFAKLVVPPIIESAYRGESLPFLNNLIKWQHIRSVDYYLQKWDGIATEILVSLLGLWLLALIAARASLLSRQTRLACSMVASWVSRLPHVSSECLGARTGFNLRAAYGWSDLGFPHLG